MKNKKFITILIVLLTMLSVFLVFKKDTSVVEKNKVSKIERKEFSIYKEQTFNGKDWKESNDTTFPTSGYLLNTTQTMCYDYNGNKIEYKPTQELTKGSIDGRVTIESSKTIYCELYFDIDNKVPEVNGFSITGKTSGGTELNNGFTYQTENIPYTLEYVDTDVTQYCISNTIECTEWTEISKKTNTLTIEATDGEKTMYIYLKDKANNVSVTTDKSTTTITVDRTAPVINTFTLTGAADTSESQTLSDPSTYTHTNNITYNASITESNIESYCVYEENCDYKTTGSTTLNTSYILKDIEGSHSVKIKVKDKAGNESDISSQSIKLDKINPVATISSSSKDTSSITVTVGYEGQDSIIARQCRESGGSWVTASNSNGSCTISQLSDGTEYTIEGRVRDASGRWNTDYPSVSVTTDKKGTPVKEYFASNPIKGLTVTDCNGMTRFAGSYDTINNYICFGYNSESDCEGEIMSNEYIYRVMGITTAGVVKLIKNIWLEEGLPWCVECPEGLTWSQSELHKDLDGPKFYDKLGSKWQNKIIEYSWPDIVSNGEYDFEAVNDNCSFEYGFPSVPGKIGLVLFSDFLYSDFGNMSDTDYEFLGYHDISSSWLFGRFEADSDNWVVGWGIADVGGGDGYARGDQFDAGYRFLSTLGNFAVRPVFYLSSDVLISSGTGSSSDPFIIVL